MDAKDFHNRINEILHKTGYHLTDLSRLSGIPYKTLTNMRSKKTLPDRTNYLKILDALNVTNEEFENGCVDDFADRSRINMMAAKIEKLSEGQQQMILDYINIIENYEVVELE